MPSPTVRDVHIDSALGNVSIAYKNEEYIGEQVFPRVPVEKQSDYYFVFDKGSWFRDEVAIRAPGTRAARADYELSSSAYRCINYALAKPIPDEVRKNADKPLKPDVEATEFVTDALLRAQERRIAAMTTGGSGLWAYSASPTTQWTGDTSDPYGDINAAIFGIISTIGRKPNVAVMSWDVWRYLMNHPDFLERIKYTRPSGQVDQKDLATWFGLQKVLVGAQLFDSAKAGQSASMGFIWGDALWIGYVPSSPALMTPAAGYVLEWEKRTISRFREDQERTDVIEGSHNVDEIVTASDAGAIIYNAV